MQISSTDTEFFNTDKTVILTLMRDETPIGLPIWAFIHDNAVYMLTDSDSKKISLLAANPKASVVAMKEPPGFPWMRVEGRIEQGQIDDFPEFDNFRQLSELIATKYVGAEEAPERYPGDNWTILKLVPDKVVSSVDN